MASGSTAATISAVCCLSIPAIASAAMAASVTATHWEIGRIVDFEQRGKKRTEYGEAPLRKYDMA
jgi:hypothetical protein